MSWFLYLAQIYSSLTYDQSFSDTGAHLQYICILPSIVFNVKSHYSVKQPIPVYTSSLLSIYWPHQDDIVYYPIQEPGIIPRTSCI